MTIRELRREDIPVLEEMFRRSGFEYEFPDLTGPEFEAIRVVVDENDAPLMAVAAKRTVELYLFCGDFEHPAAKLHSIRMLHDSMKWALKQKGYTEVNAFLPPQVEKSFGRRLMRTFGWMRNWHSYCFRF